MPSLLMDHLYKFHGTSTHRVLSTPELLDSIFSLMNQKCNASNALVSQLWSGVALDSLWRNMDSLHPLFNILAPLRMGRENFQFTRLPTPDDWIRFHSYARRVRTLRYQETSPGYRTVFDDVARTRTSLSILPNLRSLEWISMTSHSLVRYSVLFMHDKVKRFVVFLPPGSPEPFPSSYLQDISSRMPMLTHVDLGIYVSVTEVESGVVDLIRGLPRLQNITLPKTHLTTSVIEQLSSAEHLRRVYYHPEMQGLETLETQIFSPRLEEGGFPELWELFLAAQLDDIRRLILRPFFPTEILDLHIDSPVWQSPLSVREFLVALSQNCRNLRYLSLKLVDEVGLVRKRRIHTVERITFDTLRPVFTIPNIESFEITHVYPLQLTQNDMEELAGTWPLLQNLNLSCAPIVADEKSTLSFYALLPFARKCPRLKRLGLYLDASTLDTLPSIKLVPFRGLEVLCTGVSNITDEESVALFLSRILPVTCEVECGISWNSEFVEERLEQVVEERCDLWTEVARLVPLLIKSRMEERERLSERRNHACSCNYDRMVKNAIMAGINGGIAV